MLVSCESIKSSLPICVRSCGAWWQQTDLSRRCNGHSLSCTFAITTHIEFSRRSNSEASFFPTDRTTQSSNEHIFLYSKHSGGGGNKKIKKTLVLHLSACFVNVCSITKSHHSVLFCKLFIQNNNRISVLRNYMRNWDRKWMLQYYYLLTPWSRELLEKLAASRLAKKFAAFYGTRRFITTFTSARTLSLSWASSIQSIPLTFHFLKILFNIILPSTPGSSKYSSSLGLLLLLLLLCSVNSLKTVK